MSRSRQRGSIIDDEAAQLAALGYKEELQRNFSTLSMLGLAFAILNSWTALSASLSLALPSGGPTAVIWGLATAGICNLCLAASLAELLSAFPSAGGQYHWVAVISWKRWVPILSYLTGWINVSGWIALVATGGLLGSQLIVGIISFMNPTYNPQRWHQFLIYLGYTLAAFFINAFLTSALPLVTKSAFIWSLLGFTIISITILACASPTYQSGSFVYRAFINDTGWPDGIAWLLGLLQGGLGLTGFDAVAHMVEEIPRPSIVGPKIMIGCVAIGLFTGFVFLSVLLFVSGDTKNVIESTAGPILQIFYDATNNRAGSICLLMFPLICLLFATVTIMTTSSRMTYAFARDRGLPFSTFFARVHPTLHLPLNALALTTLCVIIFGCIFLGSTSAFNAITSASVVFLGLSYAIPPLICCLRLRRPLPHTRAFRLPEPVGWAVNVVGIAYVLVTTVLFVFPPELPVSGSNMNYCVVVMAVVAGIAAGQWVVGGGSRSYKGPGVDLDALSAGEVVGMEPEPAPAPAHGMGESRSRSRGRENEKEKDVDHHLNGKL